MFWLFWLTAAALVWGFVKILSPIRRPRHGAEKRPTPASQGRTDHHAGAAPASPWRHPSRKGGTDVAGRSAASAALSGRCFVVDGDTIIIAGQSIRLAGIDAPELDHPYGEKAKWALADLCRGQTVRAEPDGSSSHDRLVATCYLPDGRDLAAEMVRLGHAVDWKKYSGGRYRHLEVAGVRKRLWRCDARQKGRFPPPGSAAAG